MKKVTVTVLALLIGTFGTAAVAAEFSPDLCRNYTITVHNVSRWHIRAHIGNRVSDGPPTQVHAVVLGLERGESKTQTFTNCTGEWGMLMTASEPSDYNTPLRKFRHFSSGSGYTLRIDDRVVATWPARSQDEEARAELKAFYDQTLCMDEKIVSCILYGGPPHEVLVKLAEVGFVPKEIIVFIFNQADEASTRAVIDNMVNVFAIKHVKYYVGCVDKFCGRPPEWNVVVTNDRFTNR